MKERAGPFQRHVVNATMDEKKGEQKKSPMHSVESVAANNNDNNKRRKEERSLQGV